MTNTETTIRSLEESLLKAETLQSAEALDHLLADDFREFGSSGRIHLKEDVLGSPRPSGSVEFTVADFLVEQLAPEIALATYRVTARNAMTGTQSDSLRSSIWRLRDNRWQVVFHQGTRTGIQATP